MIIDFWEGRDEFIKAKIGDFVMDNNQAYRELAGVIWSTTIAYQRVLDLERKVKQLEEKIKELS